MTMSEVAKPAVATDNYYQTYCLTRTIVVVVDTLEAPRVVVGEFGCVDVWCRALLRLIVASHRSSSHTQQQVQPTQDHEQENTAVVHFCA